MNVTAWTSAAVIACPGRAFPLTVASIRVMPEALSDSYLKLKANWPT